VEGLKGEGTKTRAFSIKRGLIYWGKRFNQYSPDHFNSYQFQFEPAKERDVGGNTQLRRGGHSFMEGVPGDSNNNNLVGKRVSIIHRKQGTGVCQIRPREGCKVISGPLKSRECIGDVSVTGRSVGGGLLVRERWASMRGRWRHEGDGQRTEKREEGQKKGIEGEGGRDRFRKGKHFHGVIVSG